MTAPRPHPLIALAGSPNCGKTTIFNALTGLRQHVGNYAGVTVEKVEGRLTWEGETYTLVDLPGIYNLSPHSPEEKVTRAFLLDEKPELVVNIIDASNLDRGMYLTTQLLELGLPLLLVFNMMDQAEHKGLAIDLKHFSTLLGLPIVATVGHREKGLKELKQALARAVRAPARAAADSVRYGEAVERELTLLQPLFEALPAYKGAPPRWSAVKTLEGDEEVLAALEELGEPARAARQASGEAARRLHREFGDDSAVLLADHRYGFIAGACQAAVKQARPSRRVWSDDIDRLLLHEKLGLPIFLLMMFLVFKLTFALSAPLMRGIEHAFAWAATALGGLWPAGSDSALRSLLLDGVFGGVGGVLVFLPTIVLLFWAIAVLEDTGYMARAAFIMDRFMHRIGLHGKSFIPMVLGFGCSVPAILATRILESRRDRLITMFIVPLVSCGARFPIYMLIIPAFFPRAWQAPMLWLIYLIGIGLALLCARVLSRAVFKGESTPFVMELPPYRMPTLKGMLIHMGERSLLYLRKAGTLILAISVLLWALTTYPRLAPDPARSPEEQRMAALAHSAAGRIGRAIEPVLRPMGFDWKIGTALIGAFAAKEVFVAQMGIVYSTGDDNPAPLRERLRATYTPLIGFCIMLFSLIGTPCMATAAAVRMESRSWKWTLAQWGGLTLLAWALTTLVYQVGRLLGG